MFKTPLLKYTQSLLQTIALDYNLSIDELVIKYCLQDESKTPCPHNTGKGTPCKNSCLPGETHCHLHAVIKPPKPEKIKKIKFVKVQPQHSHLPGTSDPECELCMSHGDPLSIFSQQFEVS